MSEFYDEMKQVATDLIAEFGGTVAIVSSFGTQRVPGMIIEQQQNMLDVSGHSNAFNNTKVCFVGAGLKRVPEVSDTLVKDGVTYLIRTVSKLRPADTTVFYKLELGT